MKHAILITAYKDIDSLIEIVDFFNADFNFYIHLDKKSNLDLTDFSSKANVFVCNNFVVNWGGTNHLHAILLLASEAIKNGENVFFHLITGEDFPIKSPQDFLTLDISKNYIKYYELPSPVWSGNGGLDRLAYYHFYDVFNFKKNVGKNVIEIFTLIQQKLRIVRRISVPLPLPLYGGSTYWSINRDAMEYVLQYTKTNPQVLQRFNHTFCAEEIYIPTILMNSPMARTVVNDHLRFIDWTSGRGGYPAFLDESDFDEILNSNKLFARKIRKGDKLREMLKVNL